MSTPWPTAFSMIGASGATGATGAQGPPGAGGTGAQEYDTLNANMNISGGGTVTWDGSTISWNARVIVMNQNAELVGNGYLDIGPDNFQLTGWQGLYYVPPTGGNYSYNRGYMHIVNYPSSNNEVQANWIFICHHNGDDGSLRWNPGYVNIPSGGTFNSQNSSCSWVSGSGSGATGATGAQDGPGVSIYNGLEVPSNTGAQGDYFINNTTRDIYTYSTNTWNNLFSPEAYFSSIRTNAIMFSDSGPSTIQSTITISSVSTYTSTFLYTGTPETFTIPQGTTELTFEVLGGGGANAGGGGAYISGTGEIPENFSGSSVWIYVGQGGQLTGNSLGFRVGITNFSLTTSGGSAATSTDPTSVGGGGGGASGIVFESNRSRIIAGAGAGGYAYGTGVYQGGAGGLQNGSEPLEPVPPPTAITGLASTNVSSSAFTVSWSGGTGTGVTTSYTLNGSAATPSSSAAGTATFSGLTASTGYTVVVIATNTAGSVNSSLIVTTTVAPVPEIYSFTITLPNTTYVTDIQVTYDPAVGYEASSPSVLADGNIRYDTGAFTATTLTPNVSPFYIEALIPTTSDPSVGTFFFRMQPPQWFLDAIVLELQAIPGTESYYNRYTNPQTCAFNLLFTNNVFTSFTLDGTAANNLGTVGFTVTVSNLA